MAAAPLGVLALQKVSSPPCNRNVTYRTFILVLTFFAYTTYHLSRKPISVVKNVLHKNCSHAPHPKYNGTTVSPFTPLSVSENEDDCSWAPFDKDNYNELLGSLDYAFLFAYAIGMFISGHIAERMNLRYFLTIGMLGSGIFTALFGFGKYWNIHILAYYIVIQVMAGLFQATGWPSVVTAVANWFGKGKRGVIMGIWNSHTSVGNILGAVIAGAFVERSWGLSFIVPGMIIGAMGIIIFMFLVPSPEDVGCDPPNHYGPAQEISTEDVSEQEPLVQAPLDSVEVEIEQPDQSTTEKNPSPQKAISFWSALKIPGVIEFSLCLFFAKLVSYTFLFWLPAYIKHSTTLDSTKSADLSTVFDFGGIAGGILAGAISDYLGTRASVCSVMLFAAAPMLWFYQAFGNTSLAVNIVMLLVVGALVNGPYALITTAVSADLGTHHSLQGNAKALSTVTAIIDGTGSMGAALGPLLTGLISQSSWTDVFYMLIAADLLALLVSSIVWLRQKDKNEGTCTWCGWTVAKLLSVVFAIIVVITALIFLLRYLPSSQTS